jgi:sulfur carrier protein
MTMDVVVNGKSIRTEAKVLAGLVAEQELSGARIATALNGNFVPERERANTLLKAGDRIEIVSPRQGG